MAKKARVLIVEDDFALSNLWKTALTFLLADYVDGVDACYDGQTAADRVLADPPDLVILDMHLPIKEGQEVFRLVRTHPDLGGVKVVIITADAPLAAQLFRETNQPGSEVLPPDKIIVKPVDMDLFQTMVEDVLTSTGVSD